MNIDNLTIAQAREIAAMFGSAQAAQTTLKSMIGKKVIIRTYSAGCWFGILSEKQGNEVILKDARRMYSWQANESITLSACALYGIKDSKSKIVEAVESVWLEAIEIIPCTEIAIETLESAQKVKAE